MSENINGTVIYLFDGVASTSIFFRAVETIYPVPPEMLKWHEDDVGDKFLTLAEIREQIYAVSPGCGCLYVWTESPLGGAIYQTGNYKTSDWVLYGKTKGYA